MARDLHALMQELGYRFGDSGLLHTALTHRSHGARNNERLEFLGDSVLNCVISDELYRRHPGLSEGELSRARATLVRQQSLVERAEALRIGELMVLGEGELRSGGQHRPSILGDALEAVIGAVYLDGGFEAARAVVRTVFQPVLETHPASLGKDPKTRLQEFLQGRRMALPQYSIVSTEGEAHRQRFKVACSIPGLSICTVGEGLNRRAAEQKAAEIAYRMAVPQ